NPVLGFVSDQGGRLITQPALIVGREDHEGTYIGIDFLLPVLPWVEAAIHNAQSNRLDYGFALMPTVTPEDLIIAKLFAIQGDPNRPYDQDDVKSILRNQKNLNIEYIRASAEKYKLRFPI